MPRTVVNIGKNKYLMFPKCSPLQDNALSNLHIASFNYNSLMVSEVGTITIPLTQGGTEACQLSQFSKTHIQWMVKPGLEARQSLSITLALTVYVEH